jgi:hypothetical protein
MHGIDGPKGRIKASCAALRWLLPLLFAACDSGPAASCGGTYFDEELGQWVVRHEVTGRRWLRCPVGQEWNPGACECEGLPNEGDFGWARTACPEGFFWPSDYDFTSVLCNLVHNDGEAACDDHYSPCEECSVCREMFGADRGWYASSNSDLDRINGHWGESSGYSFANGCFGSASDEKMPVRCVEDEWYVPPEEPDGSTDVDSDIDTDADTDTDWCAGDDVHLDTDNGLCWDKVLTGQQLIWVDAVKHCDDLATGGYTDWRLPLIQELRTAIAGCIAAECYVTDPWCLGEYCNDGANCAHCPVLEGPAPEGRYLKDGMDFEAEGYWSASPFEIWAGNAWVVYFGSAWIYPENKEKKMWVGCVRAKD